MFNNNEKYKFIAREKTILDIQWKNNIKKIVDKRVFFIGVHDLQKDLVTPHPLTHFVIVKYENMGHSLSHQKNATYIIVRFLNYCLMQVEYNDIDFHVLREVGIRGLKRKHFSRFITFRTTMKLKYVTVKQEEHYLETFYEYLQELELIDEKYEIKYITVNDNKMKRLPLFKTAYLNTKYPKFEGEPLQKLKDFGMNKKFLVPEFIESVNELYPGISLAVALQMYGGLRIGEVLNLFNTSIKTSNEGTYYAIVKDRQETLFPHLTSSEGLQVKKPRHQQILPSGLFDEIYKKHLKMLKKQKLKNKYILFYNSKGLAMSEDDYYWRFGRAKKHFINKLEKSGRLEDAYMLKRYKWSTHIGRGIFTNFLLDMGLSVTQIALARGDRNIESALAYVDEKHTIEKIRKYVNEFKDMESNYLGVVLYQERKE